MEVTIWKLQTGEVGEFSKARETVDSILNRNVLALVEIKMIIYLLHVVIIHVTSSDYSDRHPKRMSPIQKSHEIFSGDSFI